MTVDVTTNHWRAHTRVVTIALAVAVLLTTMLSLHTAVYVHTPHRDRTALASVRAHAAPSTSGPMGGDGRRLSLVDGEPPPLPDLFIFRRTKKTGSSSMTVALRALLQPLGYAVSHHSPTDSAILAMHAFVKHAPHRLCLLQHNYATKAFHPQRHAVIADTFRDGYAQMTAFCRHMQNISTCASAPLRTCLQSHVALLQRTYRWAGRAGEDLDTYIDLPLSSAHPALSTTVLRSVFPHAQLRIGRYNARNTTCAPDAAVRAVYDRLYGALDGQVDMLRRRMLAVAGYPTSSVDSHVALSAAEMVDAAEVLESVRLGVARQDVVSASYEEAHFELMRDHRKEWARNKKGDIVITGG